MKRGVRNVYFLRAWQIQRFIRLSRRKKKQFLSDQSVGKFNEYPPRSKTGWSVNGEGYSIIALSFAPTIRWAYRRSRTRYLSTHERNVKETCAGGIRDPFDVFEISSSFANER